MSAFHRSFSLDYKQRINVAIVGATGTVGKQVHRILEEKASWWRSNVSTDVRVVCVCNSKEMTFRDPSDGSSDTHQMSFDGLIAQFKSRLYENLHIIDVTASADISAYYPQFLALGVLVTANKRASSGSLELFDQLNPHRLTRRYRYEATVMAGSFVLFDVIIRFSLF
jgi:homoserine dehydrogenase